MGGDKGPMGGVLPHPPPILDNPDIQAEIFKTKSELLINNRLSVLDSNPIDLFVVVVCWIKGVFRLPKIDIRR